MFESLKLESTIAKFDYLNKAANNYLTLLLLLLLHNVYIF